MPSDDRHPSELRQALDAGSRPGDLREALDAASMTTPSVHSIHVKCQTCGERWAIEIRDQQSATFALKCPTCGAVGETSSKWPFGRTAPVMLSDAAGDVYADTP